LNAITALAHIGKSVDPVATEAAKTGSELWGKVLGPPAEALGEHFRSRIELWSENELARRVLQRAARKIDTSKTGAVPPRVAAGTFAQAQWTDDEMVAEYLSGVLASSRTADGGDDRGVSWNAMVERLSSDALRLHYMIYSALRAQMRGHDARDLSTWVGRPMVFTYVDLVQLDVHTEFGGQSDWINRLISAAYTLERERLIAQLTHGDATHLTGFPYRQYDLPKVGDMLIAEPTVVGCSLYMEAHGHGQRWAGDLGDVDLVFDPWPETKPSVAEVRAVWLDELPPASA
jgi:hypothetical protein